MDKSKNPINARSFYDSLAKITPEAVVIHSQGKIIYANPAALRLTGFKNINQLLGRNVTEFLDENYKQKALSRIETMLKTHKEVDWMEDVFVRPDGSRLIGQVKSAPFTYEGGDVILTIIRDITQSKLSQKRQKTLEELNKALASSLTRNITMGSVIDVLVPSIADYCRIAIVDENKRIRTITKNGRFVREDLSGKLLESYLNDLEASYGIGSLIKNGKPEIIPIINEKVLENFKISPKLHEIVRKIELKSYMGVPIRLRGEVIGAITFSSTDNARIYNKSDLKFAQEIAARISLELDNIRLYKEAQDEIKERKEIETILVYLSEVSRILASSLDYKKMLQEVSEISVPLVADWCIIEEIENEKINLVGIANQDPRKVKWAKSFRKILSNKITTFSGVGWVLKTGKPQFYSKVTDDLIKESLKSRFELEAVRKIGKISSVMIVPLIIKKKVAGAITYISSNPKNPYTKADLAMAEEVARRASLAMDNSRLYTDSQKAIRIRDDFISIASHELRTPLTSLKIFTQVLEKRMKKAEDKEMIAQLGKMDRQIDKLTSLIKALLDVSRVRTGKLTFNMAYFDLNDVVKEVAESVSQISQSHEIEIEGFIKKKVFGDSDRVSQVLINLLTNAIKYSWEDRKVIIRLSSEKEVAVVSVQDFGIGIDKQHQNKIFNRFYRAADLENKTFPGLGIGLYIANDIIKRHGGEMSVISSKGRGSTFSFTLPYRPIKIGINGR